MCLPQLTRVLPFSISTDSAVGLLWQLWPLPTSSCCVGCCERLAWLSRRNQGPWTSSLQKVWPLAFSLLLPFPPLHFSHPRHDVKCWVTAKCAWWWMRGGGYGERLRSRWWLWRFHTKRVEAWGHAREWDRSRGRGSRIRDFPTHELRPLRDAAPRTLRLCGSVSALQSPA